MRARYIWYVGEPAARSRPAEERGGVWKSFQRRAPYYLAGWGKKRARETRKRGAAVKRTGGEPKGKERQKKKKKGERRKIVGKKRSIAPRLLMHVSYAERHNDVIGSSTADSVSTTTVPDDVIFCTFYAGTPMGRDTYTRAIEQPK